MRGVKRTIAAALAAFSLVAPAAAQGLYSQAQLERSVARGGDGLRLMVTEDIPRTLPRELRPAAASIGVAFHTRGRHPLDFFADPSQRTVHVPIESFRFFDDLSRLMAWFEFRGCEQAWVQAYLWALLRQGEHLPPPLEAFGLDRDAVLASPFVDDVSGKMLKSGMLFILAHEVGHILHAHIGGITGRANHAQEIEADSFALDRFAALGEVPAGALIYFLTARWIDPAGDAAGLGSHPVSPERLRAIAGRLAANPASYSHADLDPSAAINQTLTLAREMQSIAADLESGAMLAAMDATLVGGVPLDQLGAACPA